MHTVTRRLEFDAGHRILGHKGRCRHLHGHRYSVDITCYATKLDGLGMVIDFSVIKDRVGMYIDSTLDHNILLHRDDPLTKFLAAGPINIEGINIDIFGDRLPFVMHVNPTAENIARLIFTEATGMLRNHNITVQNVRVHETPNCWADYPGPPMENK